MITRAFNVKSLHKSRLIKLISFEREEVKFLYTGATGFRSHTTIFVLVLCLFITTRILYKRLKRIK